MTPSYETKRRMTSTWEESPFITQHYDPKQFFTEFIANVFNILVDDHEDLTEHLCSGSRGLSGRVAGRTRRDLFSTRFHRNTTDRY